MTLGPGAATRWAEEVCHGAPLLIAFRPLFRTGILTGSTTQAFDAWKAMYRGPFFQRFGFTVPAPVPQTLKCETEAERPVFEACVP